MGVLKSYQKSLVYKLVLSTLGRVSHPRKKDTKRLDANIPNNLSSDHLMILRSSALCGPNRLMWSQPLDVTYSNSCLFIHPSNRPITHPSIYVSIHTFIIRPSNYPSMHQFDRSFISTTALCLCESAAWPSWWWDLSVTESLINGPMTQWVIMWVLYFKSEFGHLLCAPRSKWWAACFAHKKTLIRHDPLTWSPTSL